MAYDIAIIGSCLLALGVFSPIVNAPFLFGESRSYFQIDKEYSVVILALAAISVALALGRLHKGLLLTGAIGIGIVAKFVKVIVSDFPRLQLQWGLVVLINGEIVALDRHGKTQFKDLLFRRGEPRFYAFDLLSLDGEDLRNLPLIERKLRLRSVVPEHKERLLYCDYVGADGEGLFQLACEHDLEGIVAKWKSGTYLLDQPSSWVKIRNRNYSQWVGREELFERERGGDPDFRGVDIQ
jgi:hypothetical protein